MKVALVNARSDFQQIYGDWNLSALDTRCPPLGLLHIAGCLRRQGHQPFILDLQVDARPLDEIAGELIAGSYDLIGISAMTCNYRCAAALAGELKRNRYGGVIVTGGAHMSARPAAAMAAAPGVDYGVIGEGEVTLQRLVEALESGESTETLAGIVWRDGAGGITENHRREPILDLDSLPLPAWDLLSGFPDAYPHSLLETRRLPAAAIMTSRGCPMRCTFCDQSVFGHRTRWFSADYILEMLRFLKRTMGIRDLMILDDNFLLDHDRLRLICEGMIAERMD
ncbi:cobalamin-dependent protein, partial [bacterium]|nr:cobalamin-dependent protein [candidate division CSSED10-310 bacterium]